jgi:hypothetical protein
MAQIRPPLSTLKHLCSATASRSGPVYLQELDELRNNVSGQLQAPLLPVNDDARYPQLLKLAEQNWREENPKLVRSLEKAGTFKKRRIALRGIAIDCAACVCKPVHRGQEI